ncbi:MAG: alpha/beta hydrolase [bacterium]|nr:alpha/beta hydrolase [bacterium]
MPVARDVHATLRSRRFHWLDWGRPGARPLLLLHGAAQTAHSFDEVAPDLARDHHVVALDQRGHGDSDWAPRYERADFAGDIEAVLGRLGWAQATLVAMSLGGLNAIAYAAARPARVRGLVVVDVVPTVAETGKQQIAAQLAVRDFPSFDDAVEQMHAFNPRRTKENLRDRLCHALRPRPDGTWTYKFDPEIAAGTRDLEGLWRAVARLRCPVLLVRGAESPILAREGAEQLLRTVPGSAAVEVAGAGHSVMGDNPPGFLAAVRPFLHRFRL